MATKLNTNETYKKLFFKEYMLMSLNYVSLWDLIMLLLSKLTGNSKFINSHDTRSTVEKSFSRPLFIFISIVAQKLLHLVYRPLAWVGSTIEFLLNYLNVNGGFLKLLHNLISGNKVEPRRESWNFLSFVGLIDTRVELDDKISHQDPRYNSALAIMAAKIAYENEACVQKIVQDHWKMEYIGFYDRLNAFETKPLTEKKHPTQAFIFSDKTGDHELICVSFRGTSIFSADDMCIDLDLFWYHLHGIGKVHIGFMKALGLQKNKEGKPWWPKELKEDKHNDNTLAYYKIREVLREKHKENKNMRFIVSGHSLGGALAVLFPAILALHNEFELLDRLEGVYTFGQPRVGDGEFCKFMEDLLGVQKYFRFVYANDIVPRIPCNDSDFSFKHFGRCYYFNSFYKGQVVKEVPNKNYFSIISLVTMHSNAVYELARSFLLPYSYGRNYKEGILLLGIRLFGLIFPGLSAHFTQDYVNLTRLGSPDTFYQSQNDHSK